MKKFDRVPQMFPRDSQLMKLRYRWLPDCSESKNFLTSNLQSVVTKLLEAHRLLVSSAVIQAFTGLLKCTLYLGGQ